MQYGYTAKEATAMFDRLRKEAADFYGDPYLLDVPFKVKDMGDENETTSAGTEPNFPYSVTFNSFQLPYLYEDELRAILIHEIAHVVTAHRYDIEGDSFAKWLSSSLFEGHDPEWEIASESFGSSPDVAIMPREFLKMPYKNEENIRNIKSLSWYPPTFGPLPK